MGRMGRKERKGRKRTERRPIKEDGALGPRVKLDREREHGRECRRVQEGLDSDGRVPPGLVVGEGFVKGFGWEGVGEEKVVVDLKHPGRSGSVEGLTRGEEKGQDERSG